MISSIASIALAASIIPNALAQTPDVFKPGTLVKLGVSFPSINIDPVGSALQSLDRELHVHPIMFQTHRYIQKSRLHLL
jgi:hypothetical protein